MKGTTMRIVKAHSLALLLGLGLNWATLAAADSVVSVPALSQVRSGGDVVVPVNVSPADGVISMQFELQYDPAVITPTGIAPAGVYKTAYTDGFELFTNVPSPGHLL